MRLHELNADTLSELFAHVDVQLALKMVCRALRVAAPKVTNTYLGDIVGSLPLLKWAHALGFCDPPSDSKLGRLLCDIASCGNLDGFSWALSQLTEDGVPRYPFYSSAAVAAAEKGHVHVLDWLIRSNNGPVFNLVNMETEICAAAARGGHVKVFLWAEKLGFCYRLGECMYYAANGGHLLLLRYLQQNVNWNWHLDVLKCNLAADKTQILCFKL